MRTLGSSLAGTVALAMLGGMSGVALAQQEEAGATWVTLDSSACEVVEGGETTPEGGILRYRGARIVCADEWSDPRVSGTKTAVYNDDCYQEGAPCVYWGTQVVTGPDGVWTGWFSGTVDPDRGTTGYVVMTGSDGYEGVTFVSHAMGAFGEPGVGYGLLFEGEPPPTAD